MLSMPSKGPILSSPSFAPIRTSTFPLHSGCRPPRCGIGRASELIPPFGPTDVVKYTVGLWPSGLGVGLQPRIREFDSLQALASRPIPQRSECVPVPKYDDLMLILGVLDDEEEVGTEILQGPTIERALILTDELRTELQARIIE